MYTFPDQMNWQFVQILMDSKFHSKLRVLDTDYVKQNSWAKDFFVFCSGKICLVLFQGCCSFVSRHLCPVHKINAPTPITTILATHLLHEFIVNVKHRMDWSYRKRYICLSFNSGKQYPSDGICLTSVNMQKYVTYLYDFFERVRFSLTYTEIPWLDKLPLTGKIINFPGIVTDVTH